MLPLPFSPLNMSLDSKRPKSSKKRAAPTDTGEEPASKKKTKAPLSITGDEKAVVNKTWTAIDDYQLREGVQSRIAFSSMCKSGTWSVKWAASELQARWKLVLYDDDVSEQAARNIASVHEKRRRPKFSEGELKVLERVTSPDFEGYVQLFEQNRAVWHPTRTLSMIEAQGKALRKAAGLDTATSSRKKE